MMILVDYFALNFNFIKLLWSIKLREVITGDYAAYSVVLADKGWLTIMKIYIEIVILSLCVNEA